MNIPMTYRASSIELASPRALINDITPASPITEIFHMLNKNVIGVIGIIAKGKTTDVDLNTSLNVTEYACNPLPPSAHLGTSLTPSARKYTYSCTLIISRIVFTINKNQLVNESDCAS